MSNLPGIYKIFNDEFQKYQTIYILSDTHFGDQHLKDAFPNRPSDEELVKKINSVCGKTDLIIHLGDVGDTSFVQQIKADKWLVTGNHDKGSSKYQRKFLTIKYDEEEYTPEAIERDLEKEYPGWKLSYMCQSYSFKAPSGTWDAHIDNLLFDKVFEGPVQIGEKLILSHEPIEASWAMNIHGHDHSGKTFSDIGHYNCCLDTTNYLPLNLNSFLRGGGTSKIRSIHRQTIDKRSD